MAPRTKKPAPAAPAPVVKAKLRQKVKVLVKVAPVKPVKKALATVVPKTDVLRKKNEPSPMKATAKRVVPKSAKKSVKGRAPKVEKAVKVIGAKKDNPITPVQKRFIQEYLIDLNASRAYLAANPHAKGTTARTEGSRYLANPNISAAISIAQAARAERIGISADWVIKEIHAVAAADSRDLVAYHVGCCRHCWGEGHLYQRTQAEMERDEKRHDTDTGPFDEQGGIGYRVMQEPNLECPECGGIGRGHMIIKDTRTLSTQAVALYAGVKTSKDGIELKLHSKMDALEKLAKHVGAYEADNSQKIDKDALTPEKLSEFYAQQMVQFDKMVTMVAGRKDRIKELSGKKEG